jgi:outer membrane autotransporter protein
MARRSAVLLGGTAALALSVSQPARAITINDGQVGNPEFVGGTNQFPSVVTFVNSQGGQACTGTLIDSRTILTAAHCFNPSPGPVTVSFQTDARNDPNAVPTSSVFNHAGFNPAIPVDNDIAVVSLSRLVINVKPLNLAATVPAVGTQLFLVGYSYGGSGSTCCNMPPGTLPPLIRRMATTELGAYQPTSTEQAFLRAQFRNPADPDSFNPNPVTPEKNVFRLTVPTSPLEGSTVPGDSGSPVFIMSENGLVQIGVLMGGSNPLSPPICKTSNPPRDFPSPNTCLDGRYGDISNWTPLAIFLSWVQQNDPLRQVTAAAGNFNWSNPAAWMDQFPDAANPNGAAPNNTIGDVGNNPARYYNVTLSNPGTITLDMSPQIDTLSIAGAQSQLVIGAPYTLEVLLGTTLSAGTLTMAGGTLATSQLLMTGGLLTGSGTIAGSANLQGPCGFNVCVTVADGTVRPLGTLSIQGNYTQTGGLLQFQLAPRGASGQLAVTNTATLGGTLGVTATPGLYGLSTLYTLVTAGAINGQFAQFVSPPPSTFLSLSRPVYTPTSVNVTLTRTPFGALPGLSANQRAVGNALEGAYATTLTGPAAAFYSNLLTTGTADALSQLSGEIHGSVQSVMVDDSRYIRQALLGRLRQAPYAGGSGAIAALGNGGPTLAYGESATDSALAYADKKTSFPIKAPPLAAPVEPPDLTFWAQGVGAWGKINGDGNAADASRNLTGVFTGFDRRLGDWRAGLAAGYTNSSVGVSARASSANIDTAYVAAYAGTSFSALNFRSGATFAWNTIGTSRSIAFPGFSEQATARYGAGEAQVFGEVGYGLTFGAIAAEPFAGLAWVHLDTASFTETGGVSALAGTGNKDDVGYSTLGARLASYYLLQNGMALIPRVSVAWQHAFGDVTPTAALSFQSIGAGFNILGVPIARDAALVEAGGDLQLTAQAKVGVSYAGQLANSAHDHSVKGNFTWRF